ncbi:hypothetical protein GYMLUDRAFT_752023 [Collybiopsis luxurians FD-317 M1]|uniref:Secreted protein n=1 Tax=Collybiopsis luxurians FD-317 M1 TaxID=944289 RepID=A0A0D0B2Z1_9AGAR|nr:hypothetical protein GYMLUDRAFT_752023 [Collybiopsis luxurians FD-317 M1]
MLLGLILLEFSLKIVLVASVVQLISDPILIHTKMPVLLPSMSGIVFFNFKSPVQNHHGESSIAYDSHRSPFSVAEMILCLVPRFASRC